MRIAFLGCGQATRMHSRTLARIAPDVERTYASRDGARATEFARRFGGAAVRGGYDAAIDDPQTDIVLIATPPHSHLPLALRALDAGRHVIVEKPPFPRVADFDAALEVARARERRVFIAENYFYKPLVRRLRAMLTDGVLGEIRFLHINALKQQAASGWRTDSALAGGGALFEGGIHWVDLAANIGLEVTDVHGFQPGIAPAGAERSMLVVLRYANGAVGTLSYSWEIHSPLKGVRLSRIYGTRGTLAFESNGIFIVRTGRRPRVILPGLRDIAGYAAMFRDFLEAIRTDGDPAFTAARARRDLEIVEEAYRTARRGVVDETPAGEEHR